MKKFFLGLFVITSLSLTTACSSDDDNNGGGSQGGELTVTIDGQTLTFNAIIVDEDIYTEGNETYTELDVTATINGDTSRIIQFGLETGDTGADAIYYFVYTENGVNYTYNFNGEFNTVVSVNDGSSIVMTFAGTLEGYNETTQEVVSVSLTEGNLSVNY